MANQLQVQSLMFQLPENEDLVINPISPSDYFALHFPELSKRFGPPIVELHQIDSHDNFRIQPVCINEDFFAAMLGEINGHRRIIFYLPERKFYYFDDQYGYFTPTIEEKLLVVLSQAFIHCASYFASRASTVNIKPLLQFRSESVTQRILTRAKAILAADQSFFAPFSGNRKTPFVFPATETARIFVEEAIEAAPGNIVPVQEAYSKYLLFCDVNKLPALKRCDFKEPTIEAVKNTYGMSWRKNLQVEGKWVHGWKGINVMSPIESPTPALASGEN
jgi:hypothetical protein